MNRKVSVARRKITEKFWSWQASCDCSLQTCHSERGFSRGVLNGTPVLSVVVKVSVLDGQSVDVAVHCDVMVVITGQGRGVLVPCGRHVGFTGLTLQGHCFALGAGFVGKGSGKNDWCFCKVGTGGKGSTNGARNVFCHQLHLTELCSHLFFIQMKLELLTLCSASTAQKIPLI